MKQNIFTAHQEKSSEWKFFLFQLIFLPQDVCQLSQALLLLMALEKELFRFTQHTRVTDEMLKRFYFNKQGKNLL
jgi:hypothetical protein